MRIVALGTTQFLIHCVRGLNEAGCAIQAVISLPKHLLPDNSVDLNDFAVEIGAEYLEVEDINSESFKARIRSLSPDLIFSSWPKIIDSELLAIPAHGVIGTHPTALPFNKGRHPLQWEIVLGMRESELSFFWMDSGIDAGPIILQAPYYIDPEDTIVTLTERLNTLAYSASRSLGEALVQDGVPKGTPQNHKLTNTWRKRDRNDVLIDFRMRGEDILALIRSFTEPYPCASFIFESHYFNVIQGEKAKYESRVPLQYLEPGHVVKLNGHFLYIKSASDILKLQVKQNIEQMLGSAKYIHPPTKYLAKYPALSANLL